MTITHCLYLCILARVCSIYHYVLLNLLLLFIKFPYYILTYQYNSGLDQIRFIYQKKNKIIEWDKDIMIKNLIKVFFSSSKNIPKPPQVKYKNDLYRSVHLRVQNKIQESELRKYIDEVVESQIQNNKNLTQEQQTNAIWVHLKAENLAVASYLCLNGFRIHHGLDQNISLTRWIAKKKDLIPSYSEFYISAGALLIKDDKVFLVREKNGPRKGDYGIPGGRADFGQTISSCSERQLFQQTNIKAKFKYIIHFRQLERTANGAMDIYFACVVDYQKDGLDNIKLCERQLTQYKWVHLSQYEQFCKKHSVGTQYQLAKYITNLYKKGYDFKNRLPNQTLIQNYISSSDHIQRQVTQHGLVQGIKIDKVYQ